MSDVPASRKPSMRLAVLLVLTTALLACGCHHGASHKAVAAPNAALNAAGEPQWSAQVRGDQLRFTDGGDVALSAKAARADRGKDGVVWSGPLTGRPGQPPGLLRLTTLSKPCQDADTGMTYPLTAVAEAAGHRYAGCAAPPGQGLGPRR